MTQDETKGFVKNAFWNLVLIKLNYSHLVNVGH